METMDVFCRLCIANLGRGVLRRAAESNARGHNMNVKPFIMLIASVFLASCVTAGYEGQVGAMVSSDQMRDQREANRTVRVFENAPDGYSPMNDVTVRRCHRSFVEEAPSIAAITTDLKIAAYAAGGDAISNTTTEKKNGLAANCWYVLEANAKVWRK